MLHFIVVLSLAGALAGLPQVIAMLRRRSSESQSPVGWAMATKGAAASAYVGVASGASPMVYEPAIVAAVIGASGLVVTILYRPRH